MSMQEVISIRTGKVKAELKDLYKIRIIAWASSQAMHFKPLTPSQFMPLDSDVQNTRIDKDKIAALLKRYQDAGYCTDVRLN